MQLSYHVAPHDNGWAYKLGDVWSETFPTHHEALVAARIVAERQQVAGKDAHIVYETADYRWRAEDVLGTDRPEVEVLDDYPGVA
ncbi:DUF2188 domain-containing protein [Ochrobactrum soli]|uniref:DUF2188 domain-containing protein n=1 Tax=Ochrobactrum soli TaxID=2448455 RepID=UPI000D69E09E|nr:DUF2188 domain-containing protein [[Ochrobactrum] soli]